MKSKTKLVEQRDRISLTNRLTNLHTYFNTFIRHKSKTKHNIYTRQILRSAHQTTRNFCRQTSCHLMSKTSTATVDHHADLSCFFNSHLACTELIVDLVHNLDLSIVITSTQGAQLPRLSHRSRDITAIIQNCQLLQTTWQTASSFGLLLRCIAVCMELLQNTSPNCASLPLSNQQATVYDPPAVLCLLSHLSNNSLAMDLLLA